MPLFNPSSDDVIYAKDFGVVADGVTDNYNALVRAVAVSNARGAELRLPLGKTLINMSGARTSISLSGSRITGSHNVFDVNAAAASLGAWVHVTGVSASPFSLGNNTGIYNVSFKYPAQTNLAAQIAYPPTITINGSTVGVSDCICINARTFIYAQSGGFYEFHRNRISAFSAAINIGPTAAECHIAGNDFSNAWGQAFYFLIYGEYTTLNTAVAAATAIFFSGDSNDAVHILDNGFLGYDIGIAGGFNGTETGVSGIWSIINGNTFDHCRIGLDLENKYRARNLAITNNEIDGTVSGSSFGALIGLTGANTCAIAISGNNFGGTGGKHLHVTSSNAAQTTRLSLAGNNFIAPGTSNTCIYVDGSGIQFNFSGGCIDGDGVTGTTGIIVNNARSVNITGGTWQDLVTGLSITGTIAKDVIVAAVEADTVTTPYVKTGTVLGIESIGPVSWNTFVGAATTATFTNKTFDTAGAGNSFLINGVAVTANTGTGAIARAAGPTFTTPVLGAATATTINGAAIDNNAWTTYTPTVTANAGSFLGAISATGHYKDIGKTRHISVVVTVTTVNSANTSASIPLPNGAAAFRHSLSAQDANLGTAGANGAALIAASATAITWAPGNGGIFEAGHVYVITGTIEMT